MVPVKTRNMFQFFFLRRLQVFRLRRKVSLFSFKETLLFVDSNSVYKCAVFLRLKQFFNAVNSRLFTPVLWVVIVARNVIKCHVGSETIRNVMG